jgi:signal transduction histidine kinase
VAALRPDASTPARCGWLTAICALALGRFVLTNAYFKANPSPAEAPRWGRRYAVAIGMNGVAWGALPLLFPAPGHVAVHALMSFVLGGMVAGATATASSDQRSFRAFVIPALAPMIATLALGDGRVNLAMALMLTLYGVAMAILARNSGRSFAHGTRLRLRNERLVQRLAEARDQLEQRVLDRTAELRATLEEQRRAEAKALQAVAARDEFLAVASHELLTPLSALQLQVRVLEHDVASRPPGGDRSVPSVLSMNRQVARMAALVDTVFRVSGLDRGQLVLDARAIDLSAIIRAAVSDLEASGALSSSSGAVALRLHEPMNGCWDPVRVEQIVMNLLTNALKYGDGKLVTIALQGDPQDARVALLSISDQGCGIATAELDNIFEKFHRGDAGRRGRGLGLGLFVVRELVTAMGGRISVSSTVGQGSTFRVSLPGRKV